MVELECSEIVRRHLQVNSVGTCIIAGRGGTDDYNFKTQVISQFVSRVHAQKDNNLAGKICVRTIIIIVKFDSLDIN